MANSPILFGGNNASIGLQNRILMANGVSLSNNGAKNYITYNNFANGLTTGWDLGTTGTLTNGLPTGTPSFSSSPALATLTTTPTKAIAGLNSLSFNTSSGIAAGIMMHSDSIAVDLGDRAKVLTFQVYYNCVGSAQFCNFSGTKDNTLAYAIYDVTNSAWLPVTGQFSFTNADVVNGSASGIGIASGTFQTNVTTANLRVVLYYANAPSGGSGATFLFDRFFLGPQSIPQGAVVSDWQSYTPTGSWVSNTSYVGKWQRVGDSIVLDVSLTLSGTPTSTTLTVDLPPGMTIDTAKLTAPTQYNQGLGSAQARDVSANFNTASIRYNSPTSLTFTADNGGLYTQAVPFAWASGDVLSFITQPIPIAGWSSNVQMSSDTDTRVVAFNGYVATNQALTANVTNLPLTASQDTHAGWNGTGYVIPVSGDYQVSCALINASGGASYFTYVNAVETKVLTTVDTVAFNSGFTTLSKLKAGDIVTFRSNGAVTALGDVRSSFCITRISGPSVLAASESVNCTYYNSSGQSIPNSSPTTITGWTRGYDTHNAFNPTTGVYTIPMSGKYRISSTLIYNSATWTVAANTYIQASMTGTKTRVLATVPIQATFTNYFQALGAITENYNAGDTIILQAFQNSGGAKSLLANNDNMFMSIERVGN